jgi:D-tyrosyl-tRNA(Tyr) deacylase
MRVVIQRSKESYVEVNNTIVGKIDKGLVILVGFTNGDSSNDIDYIVKKVLSLRIFDDNNGVMNLSVKDIGGSILSISQFTLYADTKNGNRPSYINSLNKDEAIILYNEFNNKLKEQINVEKGIFKADMKVTINNDGPVTIIIDSKDK